MVSAKLELLRKIGNRCRPRRPGDLPLISKRQLVFLTKRNPSSSAAEKCSEIAFGRRRELSILQPDEEYPVRQIQSSTSTPSCKNRFIDAFGIVAAVCSGDGGGDNPAVGRRRCREGTPPPMIIGVDGRLPWGSLPRDRRIFEDLTRDTILIVGRRTLLEERDGNLDHVRHAKHCIVVSKSMATTGLCSSSNCGSSMEFESDSSSSHASSSKTKTTTSKRKKNGFGFLHLARSFDEALVVARNLLAAPNSDTNSTTATNSRIPCWVAGGERLYKEALQHPAALEVHLSVIDFRIDTTSGPLLSQKFRHVARFPDRSQWESSFQLVHTVAVPKNHDNDNEERQQQQQPGFVYHRYKRIGLD